MAKKIFLFLTAIALGIGYFSNVAYAQQSEEAVTLYSADISVNIDNSINVVETIKYNTGLQERHGMYRNISLYSSQNRKMSIKEISVVDKNNNAYPILITNEAETVNIRIGDPKQTFVGEKTYIIKYRATKAVAQFDDFDEIYWNVTGNAWIIPIYNTEASVRLPDGAIMKQSACYYGYKGSTDKCQLVSQEKEKYVFSAPSHLSPYEGLTVAVGFQKGVVNKYSLTDKFLDIFNAYAGWIIGGLLLVLTLIFSLIYWYKYGRDDRRMRVIVPQYDAPEGLTPLESAGIVNERVTDKDISAEIIYLATKGYLKIRQLEKGFMSSDDYEIIKSKDFSDISEDFDRKILEGLFFLNKQTVKISELEKSLFSATVRLAIASVMNTLVSKGYYKNLGLNNSKEGKNLKYLSVFAFLAVSFCLIFLREFVGQVFFGVAVSSVIYAIVAHFYPARPEKGVAAREYILGLKEYLRIAEKNRLEFHNAPNKKPEIFEKLLPYAMALGVADIWAKEFEGIYTTPPSWYSGASAGTFNAVIFSHQLSSFSSVAIPSYGGAGSGGGGASGGGGGGGGGGGW